jgi:hypothetical protein
LDVSVSRYEFPEEAEGYDANWLVVDVSVSSPAGAWTASAACMLTYDLLDLAYWIFDVEASEAETWCGYDGYLFLTSLGWFRGRAVVAAKLTGPLSNPVSNESDPQGRDLVLVWLSREEVRAAQAALDRAIQLFPARGEHGRRGASGREKRRGERLSARARRADPSRRPQSVLQAQYLSFIHYYTKVHRRPPEEAEMGHYFSAPPHVVQQMLLSLENLGLISQVSGQARSVKVLVDANEIPPLQ